MTEGWDGWPDDPFDPHDPHDPFGSGGGAGSEPGWPDTRYGPHGPDAVPPVDIDHLAGSASGVDGRDDPNDPNYPDGVDHPGSTEQSWTRHGVGADSDAEYPGPNPDAEAVPAGYHAEFDGAPELDESPFPVRLELDVTPADGLDWVDVGLLGDPGTFAAADAAVAPVVRFDPPNELLADLHRLDGGAHSPAGTGAGAADGHRSWSALSGSDDPVVRALAVRWHRPG